MSMRYVADKLTGAVDWMATSTHDLPTRVGMAYIGGLSLLFTRDFPDEAKDEWEDFQARLTKEEAVADEGTVMATVAKMDEEEAEKLAEMLVNLKNLVHYHVYH